MFSYLTFLNNSTRQVYLLDLNIVYYYFVDLNYYNFFEQCLLSSGLNFQDLMVRQGAIDSPPKCPFILGFECAGDIEQVGEGVEDFQVSIHEQILLLETLFLIIKCIVGLIDSD